MEANNFAILWQFLPYIHMNQPWVYMCSPSWPSLPPATPSHPSWSSQCTSPEHPVSSIKPGLAIYFTYDNIHVSLLFSQIIPPSHCHTESKSLFFTSVSLLLSCIQGHHYHLSKFHIYVLVYCTGVFFFFLTDFTLYNRHQFHLPHKNWLKCVLFNSWVIFHCVYVLQLSYPFICWWTSRLLPCPSYCKQCCNEHWSTWVSFSYGFSWCVCPAVGLLGHKAVLFPVF